MSRVPPYRRNVNTVFQQYALFPHMNVWDNVAFGPRSRKVGDAETTQRVGEMLEIVRLGDFAKRKPGQLSGGQQQRVALARALVNYPSALLLDEPLGALDLKLRQAMQIELKRIQREVGITFIFVTHDQEEALTMSDRIAVMSDGYVEQIGAARGDLPPPRDGVRRRVHRQRQPLPHRTSTARDGSHVAGRRSRRQRLAVPSADGTPIASGARRDRHGAARARPRAHADPAEGPSACRAP